jgi:type II secretory pathway pseudopilin PulG
VKDDAGMTVIETVVAMSLAGVLLAVVGSVYLSSLSAMSDQRARTSLTAEARIVMESVARRTRVAIRPAGEAAAIVTATPTSLTLYSSVMADGVTTDPAPVKAEYYVDRGCLMEARTPARKLASPLPSGQLYAWDTGRRVACLAHLRGDPVFSYYDSAALTVGGTTVPPLPVPGGGLTAAVRTNVRSIGLSLTVADPQRQTAGGVPLSTRVTLTNLATDAVGG